MAEPLDTCPHDGNPLVLLTLMDGDETHVWPFPFFACETVAIEERHTFCAEPDGLGGFVAVDEVEVARG